MSIGPTSGVESKDHNREVLKPSSSKGKRFLQGMQSNVKSAINTLNRNLNPFALYREGKAVAEHSPGESAIAGTFALLGGASVITVGVLGGAAIGVVGALQLPFSPITGSLMLAGGLAIGVTALVIGTASTLLGAALIKESIASADWRKKNPVGSEMHTARNENRLIAEEVAEKLQSSALDTKTVKKAQKKLEEIGKRRLKSKEEESQALGDMTSVISKLHTEKFSEFILPIAARVNELGKMDELEMKKNRTWNKVFVEILNKKAEKLGMPDKKLAKNVQMELKEIGERPIGSKGEELHALNDMKTLVENLPEKYQSELLPSINARLMEVLKQPE